MTSSWTSWQPPLECQTSVSSVRLTLGLSNRFYHLAAFSKLNIIHNRVTLFSFMWAAHHWPSWNSCHIVWQIELGGACILKPILLLYHHKVFRKCPDSFGCRSVKMWHMSSYTVDGVLQNIDQKWNDTVVNINACLTWHETQALSVIVSVTPVLCVSISIHTDPRFPLYICYNFLIV